MQVVGRGDEDRVDGLFLLEHDPEILVRGAGIVGRFARVMLLDFRLHRPAARLAGVVPPGEVPFLRRIGQRDDLAVLLLEEGTGVGPALAARADDRDVHLVAGGDEA